MSVSKKVDIRHCKYPLISLNHPSSCCGRLPVFESPPVLHSVVPVSHIYSPVVSVLTLHGHTPHLV